MPPPPPPTGPRLALPADPWALPSQTERKHKTWSARPAPTAMHAFITDPSWPGRLDPAVVPVHLEPHGVDHVVAPAPVKPLGSRHHARVGGDPVDVGQRQAGVVHRRAGRRRGSARAGRAEPAADVGLADPADGAPLFARPVRHRRPRRPRPGSSLPGDGSKRGSQMSPWGSSTWRKTTWTPMPMGTASRGQCTRLVVRRSSACSTISTPAPRRRAGRTPAATGGG